MATSKVTWTNNSPSEQGGDLKAIPFLGGLKRKRSPKNSGLCLMLRSVACDALGLSTLTFVGRRGVKVRWEVFRRKLLKRGHRCFGDFFWVLFFGRLFCFWNSFNGIDDRMGNTMNWAPRLWGSLEVDMAERGAVGVFRREYWVDLGRFSVVAKTSRSCRFSFVSSNCRVFWCMDFEHRLYFGVWIPWPSK